MTNQGPEMEVYLDKKLYSCPWQDGMHWIKLYNSVSYSFKYFEPGRDLVQNITNPDFCSVTSREESSPSLVAVFPFIVNGLSNDSQAEGTLLVTAKRSFVLLIQEMESFIPSTIACTATQFSTTSRT